MATRILTLAGVMVLVTYASIRPPLSHRLQNESSAVKTSRAKDQWPDLNVIALGPGKKLCDMSGDAGDIEEAANNRLMNRYRLPEAGFEPLTVEELSRLPQGEIGSDGTLTNVPTSDNSHQRRAVVVTGFVTDVLVLGCGARSETKATLRIKVDRPGTESSNCHSNDLNSCDTQILVTSDPMLPRRNGRNLVVFEVTPRSRFLAARNLLTSNIGRDWSVGVLRKRLVGHQVRFSGWLFFDPKYRERAWAGDPNDTVGKPNARQTAWELHPLIGIEVIDEKSKGPKKRSAGRN